MVQVYEQMQPPAEMLMSFLPFDLHSCVVITLPVSVQVYEQMEPPAEMLMSLLPFQKEFLAWAISQERSEIRGGILADEMGMGKTIQVPYRSLHRMCDNLYTYIHICSHSFHKHTYIYAYMLSTV